MRQGKLNTEPQCLGCKAKIDGFTDPVGDATPKPGDLTVCAYCGHVMEFTGSVDSMGVKSVSKS